MPTAVNRRETVNLDTLSPDAVTKSLAISQMIDFLLRNAILERILQYLTDVFGLVLDPGFLLVV